METRNFMVLFTTSFPAWTMFGVRIPVHRLSWLSTLLVHSFQIVADMCRHLDARHSHAIKPVYGNMADS